MNELLLICAIAVTCSPFGDVNFTHALDIGDVISSVEVNHGVTVKKVNAYEIIKNKHKYLGCIVVTGGNYLEID